MTTDSNFKERIYTDKEKLRQLLSKVPDNKRIVGFGAARSANLFIEFHNLGPRLDYIVDDNEDKIGKYLTNSTVEIRETKTMEELIPDYVIILAWIHTARLTEKILTWYPDAQVITLFPEIKLIKRHPEQR